MTKTGNCPACGAPITFKFAGAVQTVCDFCKSILVRTDVDLEKVGMVSELPEDASPVQIGTEGIFENRSFVITGRIIYEYAEGTWNEWHGSCSDGSSLWVSDAQLNYAVTWAYHPPAPVPDKLDVGQRLQLSGTVYEVTTMTLARYRGVEGDLPFQYWDKSEVLFVDMGTPDKRFGTVDFSETPPLVFLGRAVDFAELKLKYLREFEGW